LAVGLFWPLLLLSQNTDLHDGRSTHVPQTISQLSPSDIDSQLQVLNERISSIQRTVERIEDSDSKLNEKVNGLEVKLTSMEAKEQGKTEASDSSFKYVSNIIVPLFAAVAGGLITAYATKRLYQDAPPPEPQAVPAEKTKATKKRS
jgi:hypothetical protein